MSVPHANPFYAARDTRSLRANSANIPSGVTKVVIGNATLYRADCFDVLPTLEHVDTVITDPPYGISFAYRSYDDAPGKYAQPMAWLVPQLIRLTIEGPCFVWQRPHQRWEFLATLILAQISKSERG